jgi:hypothetical protein
VNERKKPLGQYLYGIKANLPRKSYFYSHLARPATWADGIKAGRQFDLIELVKSKIQPLKNYSEMVPIEFEL